MTRLEQAQELAAAGLWLFPVKAGAKVPAHKGWQREITRNPETLRQWFDASDFNIGIFTGKFGDGSEALAVIDVDRKAGKDGAETIARLEADGAEFPDTREHLTASGGTHAFYRVPAAVKQGANVLGFGVDIRSRGGFVVAPGSVIDGKRYVVAVNAPIADAPQWLIDKCGAPREREPVADAPAVHADPESARARGVAYLQDAPIATEGGRNDSGFRTAARLKDFGVDRETCLALMAEHWRCDPPLDGDELAHVVNSAFTYGIDAPGSAAPEADFKPIAETPAPAAAKPRLFFELFANVIPEIGKPALVEGLLDHGAMSVLYGESNTGKTFVALDIAFHVASGTAWQGRAVEQGAAIYIAAEGGGHIRKRIVALRTQYALGSQPVPLALVPCPVDLSGDGADVQGLLDLISAVEHETQRRSALIVVDTLARALAGGNENAPDDMGAFVRNVDRLRNATKAHLLSVHHSGKDRAKGARGHSSLRAATDTEIEVADRIITATKQRDMDAGRPIGFDLLPVEIGKDGRGHPVTSCVVIERSIGAAEDFDPQAVRPGSVAGRALEVLENLTLGGIGKIPTATWRDEFIQRHYSENKKAGWNAFDRAVRVLNKARRILISENHVSPIV